MISSPSFCPVMILSSLLEKQGSTGRHWQWGELICAPARAATNPASVGCAFFGLTNLAGSARYLAWALEHEVRCARRRAFGEALWLYWADWRPGYWFHSGDRKSVV